MAPEMLPLVVWNLNYRSSLALLVVLLSSDWAQAETVETVATPPPEVPQGSVSLDPTGALLWGPSVSGEYNFGPFTTTAMYRLFGMGLASQFIYADSHEFVHPFYSFGFSVRGTLYQKSELAGWNGGVGVEYVRAVLEEDDYSLWAVGHYVVPALHGGYRFPLGLLFIGTSVSVNYAFLVGDSSMEPGSDDSEDIGNEGAPPLSDGGYLGGDFRLEFGVYF